MDPHSPNKLIATKYWVPILGDDTSFFFFLSSFFFFMLFYVILFILLLLVFQKLFYFYSFFLFFMKIILIFSCSVMFRNVPECSVFRVLSTPVFSISNMIDYVYISFFGIRYLAFGFWHLLFGIQCFKKHFVSISSVIFWHLYSTHAFKGAKSLPEAISVLTLGIQMQTRHSRSIPLHVHLNISALLFYLT